MHEETEKTTPPMGKQPRRGDRKPVSADRKKAYAAGTKSFLDKAKPGAGIMGKLGGAMGMLNGVGGAAFGVMGLLQLLEMVGGGGAQADRASDGAAAQSFLEDPLREQEGEQMALRQVLGDRMTVSGPGLASVGGGYSDAESMFLEEMEARHGSRMQERMRRTPASMAEIAAVAGLM